VLRQLGLGHTHFRSRFLTDNTKGIYAFEREFNASPALIPSMTWMNATRPDAPTEFKPLTPSSSKGEGAFGPNRGTRSEERGARSEVTISWKAPKNLPSHSGEGSGVRILYNVYASPVCPVDISDPRNTSPRASPSPISPFQIPFTPLPFPFTPLSLPYTLPSLPSTAMETRANRCKVISHQPPTLIHQPSAINPQPSPSLLATEKP
ncbi:MAG: hypothetical protein IKN21_06295, partial [Prevotella sp.]|nr:hypothetical protein [Prevotella sp.]